MSKLILLRGAPRPRNLSRRYSVWRKSNLKASEIHSWAVFSASRGRTRHGSHPSILPRTQLSSFSTSRIKIFYTTLHQSAQSLQGTLPSGTTRPYDSLSSSTAFPPRRKAAGHPCTPQYNISSGSLGVPCRPMCMIRIDFGFRS
jgi:hypothetical protein